MVFTFLAGDSHNIIYKFYPVPRNKVFQELITKLLQILILYVLDECFYHDIKYQWAKSVSLKNNFSSFDVVTGKRVSQYINMKVTTQTLTKVMTSLSIWWYYFNTISIKLWSTSLKAICKSIRVIVIEPFFTIGIIHNIYHLSYMLKCTTTCCESFLYQRFYVFVVI